MFIKVMTVLFKSHCTKNTKGLDGYGCANVWVCILCTCVVCLFFMPCLVGHCPQPGQLQYALVLGQVASKTRYIARAPWSFHHDFSHHNIRGKKAPIGMKSEEQSSLYDDISITMVVFLKRMSKLSIQ